jgi:hypothetical protein
MILVHSIVIVAGGFLAFNGDFSLLAAEAAALAFISPLLRLCVKLLEYVVAMERPKPRLILSL